MPISSSNTLSFDEMVKRMDKNEVKTIVELIAQVNQMISSIMVKEGNEVDGNTTVVRSRQPTGQWTSMSEGVQPESSSTREIWDAAGVLEGYSMIPMRYLDKAANFQAALEQEIVAFVQGFSENVEDKIFHGDRRLDPKEFFGLDARFDSLSAETGGQIIDAGGVGNVQTDLWFVAWGDSAVSTFFGKNGMGGMKVRPQGEMTVDRSNDGKYQQCWVTYFAWEMGLMIEDYRAVSRLANVNETDLVAGTLGYNLNDQMIRTYDKLPRMMKAKEVRVYCNQKFVTALTIEASNKSNNFLTMANWQGEEVVHFMGKPIIPTDTITGDNAPIV